MRLEGQWSSDRDQCRSSGHWTYANLDGSRSESMSRGNLAGRRSDAQGMRREPLGLPERMRRATMVALASVVLMRVAIAAALTPLPLASSANCCFPVSIPADVLPHWAAPAGLSYCGECYQSGGHLTEHHSAGQDGSHPQNFACQCPLSSIQTIALPAERRLHALSNLPS